MCCGGEKREGSHQRYSPLSVLLVSLWVLTVHENLASLLPALRVDRNHFTLESGKQPREGRLTTPHHVRHT